jgi:hypothetical protein
MLTRTANPGGRDVEFTNQARAATRAFTQRPYRGPESVRGVERTAIPRRPAFLQRLTLPRHQSLRGDCNLTEDINTSAASTASEGVADSAGGGGHPRAAAPWPADTLTDTYHHHRLPRLRKPTALQETRDCRPLSAVGRASTGRRDAPAHGKSTAGQTRRGTFVLFSFSSACRARPCISGPETKAV